MIIAVIQNGSAQIDVVWNATANANGVTGSVPGTGINVAAVLLTGGNAVIFDSPAFNAVNLNAPNLNNTFCTRGPGVNSPSQSMSIQFTQPVIVTRFSMADIDAGGTWDDSFTFANGFAFSQFTGTVCTALANGALTAGNVGPNAEFATWTCSPPTNLFTLNYAVTNGTTHAYLAYYVQVIPVPLPLTVCKNSAAPAFPAIGQITGVWSQPAIDTSTVGNTIYTFTPNAGQALTCPVSLTVSVQDCCLPTAVLSQPGDNMSNNSPASIKFVERHNSITATNIIQQGNQNYQDGVVYHANDFVDMLPGFEAQLGAQFVAEPLDCGFAYDYRMGSAGNVSDGIKHESYAIAQSNARPNEFILSKKLADNAIEITMINSLATSIEVTALDGKLVDRQPLDKLPSFLLPCENLPTGVYIVTVGNDMGKSSTQKFIKN